MKQDLLATGYVQVDETPISCNDPDLRDGKTTTGWLWALSRPGGEVVFEWRQSRRHEEAEGLLGRHQGLLHSDGYEAYPAYVRTHPGVIWLGCWAHARRKFHEALAEAPARDDHQGRPHPAAAVPLAGARDQSVALVTTNPTAP
jgi:hypothetical protein